MRYAPITSRLPVALTGIAIGWLPLDAHSLDAGGTAENGDAFGYSVATGDFDGDGYDDLVVGVPFDNSGAGVYGGSINVMYGAAEAAPYYTFRDPYDYTPPVFVHNDVTGFASAANDGFGYAVATGDFDADGYDDIAVGLPFDNIGAVTDGGSVDVFYGSASGITATGAQNWTQDSAGILDQVEASDRFGYALATGDFNGDGVDDLAIGVPGEGVLSGGTVYSTAGMVNVLYGVDTVGLDDPDDDAFDQVGLEDSPEGQDFFGAALASGDFNGDGYDDLVVGVPWEDVGSSPTSDAGAVNVIYSDGASSGLSTTDNKYYYENLPVWLGSSSETDDEFGRALATGDFQGDGYDDIAVGVPGDGTTADEGSVCFMYFTSSGLTLVTPAQFTAASIAGMSRHTDDRFGAALATGDFDDDGVSDLAVGIPYRDFTGMPARTDVGAVAVFYSNGTNLSTTGSQWWDAYAIALNTRENDANLGWSLASADFDNDVVPDGFNDDLAIGVPYDVFSGHDYGSVQVLRGSAGYSGLHSGGSVIWRQ